MRAVKAFLGGAVALLVVAFGLMVATIWTSGDDPLSIRLGDTAFLAVMVAAVLSAVAFVVFVYLDEKEKTHGG